MVKSKSLSSYKNESNRSGWLGYTIHEHILLSFKE